MVIGPGIFGLLALISAGIFGLLALGAFRVAFKGFSHEGMPLTKNRRIQGPLAYTAAIFALFAGLFFVWMAIAIALVGLRVGVAGFIPRC